MVEIPGEAKTAVGAGTGGAGAAHLLGTGLTNSTLRTRT